MSKNIYRLQPGKKLTHHQFIKRAKHIHGSKFDYSKTNYINWKTKIIVICPIHGEFQTYPIQHLKSKTGCQECSGRLKFTKEKFVLKAIEVHDNKYDYSEVVYKRCGSKVTIICPVHGKFQQTPDKHVRGQGCPRCARNVRCTTDEFILKSKQVHGSKYDYSKVKYKNAHTKVIIICPSHGEFKQAPMHHVRGEKCPKCSQATLGGQGWDYSNVDKPGILYLISCQTDSEKFCKVGITGQSIKNRFGKSQFKIIKSKLFKGAIGNLFKREQEILKKFKNLKYKPKIKFNGHTECFDSKAFNSILHFLSS